MDSQESKNAVVLYGFLRTYKTTFNSLIKNIIIPNKADLIIFAPNREGAAKFDKLYNNDANDSESVSEQDLKNTYGSYLKSGILYKYDEHNIIKDICFDNVDIIANISPKRVASTFYHIKKSLETLELYEKEHNFKYDNIILTRGDIAFYSKLNIDNYNLNNINIPKGINFRRDSGEFVIQSQPVYYYKNVLKGVSIPANMYRFNDLFIVSKRDNIINLKNLYNNFQQMLDDKIPCNPETMMFYELFINNDLKIENSLDMICELFRPNYKDIENINDLPLYLNIRKLTNQEEKILRNPKFYKLYYKFKYLFNKQKYCEKKEIINTILKRFSLHNFQK